MPRFRVIRIDCSRFSGIASITPSSLHQKEDVFRFC